MDEKRSKAVTEAFVRLYKEGLIYRYAAMAYLFCLVLVATLTMLTLLQSKP